MIFIQWCKQSVYMYLHNGYNDIQWYALICHVMQWYSMIFNDIQWYSMINELQWAGSNVLQRQWSTSTLSIVYDVESIAMAQWRKLNYWPLALEDNRISSELLAKFDSALKNSL